MADNTNGCSALIGSVTQAMRAQSVLGTAAIPTTVIKSESAKGCVYGVRFSCSQMKNVSSVFEKEKIRVKKWNTVD